MLDNQVVIAPGERYAYAALLTLRGRPGPLDAQAELYFESERGVLPVAVSVIGIVRMGGESP